MEVDEDMRKTRIDRALLLLTCLSVLALTADAQTAVQRRRRQPSGLYRVVIRDEKSSERRMGFIDKTGRLVINFDRLPRNTFAVGEFNEGRAVLYLKEGEVAGNPRVKAGYIDAAGNVVITPRFYSARDFSEGLAYVEAEKFRGFIDRRGVEVIRLDDDLSANDFHEGLAAVGPREWWKGGDWGYIDRAGKLVIKRQYQLATDFSEGLAGVAVEGKYGFIDVRGDVVIPLSYDLIRDVRHPGEPVDSGHFSEGLACVRVDGLYGYVDKGGRFVITPQFAAAQDFSDGLAWVVRRDEKTYIDKRVGWIDKAGRWVVNGVNGRAFTPEMREFSSYSVGQLDWRYSEGLVPFFVYEGAGKVLRGYMNRKGRVVIKPRELDGAGPFVGGIAKVFFNTVGTQRDDETYGYIDRTGRLIWPKNNVRRAGDVRKPRRRVAT